MSESVISLSNVVVRYRRRKSFFRHDYHYALRSVSFDVFHGETIGIIGKNGCGKSTLMRLLAGIYAPDSGVIETHNANIALLALSTGFDAELSGRDNIIISAMLLGATKRKVLKNINGIVEFSELGSFIDEPVKTYSSGMRMRLGFSTAICIQPDVLLIDEVLGVGDAYFRRKAETALADRITSSQTVVLVSHSMEQVKRLCDRAVWLHDGQVSMQGEAHAVVDCYQKFVLGAKEQEHSKSKHRVKLN